MFFRKQRKLERRVEDLEDVVKLLAERVKMQDRRTLSETTREREKEEQITASQIIREWLNGEGEDNG